jgi:hypothetical protein
MSNPSNIQPSQAAMPDFHCCGDKSRRRVAPIAERGAVSGGLFGCTLAAAIDRNCDGTQALQRPAQCAASTL